MSKLQWLFFDIGSTLVDESKAYEHRIKDTIAGSNITYERFYETMLNFWKQGKKGDTEAARLFNLKLEKWHSEDEFLYPETHNCLEKLSQKYKIGIIANQALETEGRLAIIADADAIYILNRDELGYDYPLEQTKEKLANLLSSKTDKIFAAAVGNQVVGYVHTSDYDVIYAPHMKNITGIAVAKEYRHNGIGAALLQAVENWAKKTGACGVRLCSGESRTGAHEFYRHCGYSCGKRQLNFKKIFKEGKNDK